MKKTDKQITIINNSQQSPTITNDVFFSNIWSAIRSGIIGFLIVFSLIIITKSLSASIKGLININFSVNDLIISSWGFIIFSFIVFAGKNKNNISQ